MKLINNHSFYFVKKIEKSLGHSFLHFIFRIYVNDTGFKYKRYFFVFSIKNSAYSEVTCGLSINCIAFLLILVTFFRSKTLPVLRYGPLSCRIYTTILWSTNRYLAVIYHYPSKVMAGNYEIMLCYVRW